MKATEISYVKGIIGAVVDERTRAGKEEKVAMEMAISDFFNHTNQRLILRVKNSKGQPVQAALAAKDLIDAQNIEIILGPRSWEEAKLVAELCSQSQIPIVTFADFSPWAMNLWPFLIQASPSQHMQMKAVAAIVQSWGWRRVTVICEEDAESASNGLIVPHLYDDLREIGAEISNFTVLWPYITSTSLSEELKRLKKEQCRVFVVHTSSSPLTKLLFEEAKKMDMMGQDYVWITTDATTSLLHSFNSSTLSSMQGVLGVKTYFPETGPQFQDFYTRFCTKFISAYPEEEKNDPGIFAVQAYDATWAVALAIEEGSIDGKDFIETVLETDFIGLSGRVKFVEQKLAPTHVFQIINIVGKSYRELGFWYDGLGFSTTIDGEALSNDSMKILGQVYWPGGPWSTPKGWTLPKTTNPLRIGVPEGDPTKRFAQVYYDNTTNSYYFGGFSIAVFKATLKHLPYDLPYEFIPFDGSYDALVEKIHLKEFDAVVGDVAIISSRCSHAEFTQPHTESGLLMVVPVRSQSGDKALLFTKPFTRTMWFLTAFVTVYNGFVIWIIERPHSCEHRSSVLNQTGTLLWLSFTTLLSLNGEKLHSNLSRMAVVAWLFVALIITQSYSANLTSMLTVQRLQPTVADIETLKYSNALVGYARESFVGNYLVEVLQFKIGNCKSYSTIEEYALALRNEEIAAAFLEAPVAKLLLAKYCKEEWPAYWAFPRGSPFLPDINKGLLEVSERGELLELEKTMIVSEKCVDEESDHENVSLSPSSFWVLFILTGSISTAALAIYVIQRKIEYSMLLLKTTWVSMWIAMQQLQNQKSRFCKRVGPANTVQIGSNTSDSLTQV
ncbi:unnamed protein product [Ilex paraguariensis]|uniref:Glutamate receptor n=1 Tax=Ilex paraguariensis TaxID=185542 RepID=A0ABC8UPG4_9AQUA